MLSINITQVELIAVIIIMFLSGVWGIGVLISFLRRVRHWRDLPIIQHESGVQTIPSALRRPPPKIVVPPARMMRQAEQPIIANVRSKPAIVRPTESLPVQFMIDASQ